MGKICLKLREIYHFPKPKSFGPIYLSIIMTLCRRSCRKRVLQEYQKAKLVFFNQRADFELYDYEVAQELIRQIKKLDRRIQKYGIKCDRCTRE